MLVYSQLMFCTYLVKPQDLEITGDKEGLDEGTTGKLTCNVTSVKPKPILTWTKKGWSSYIL